MKLDSQTISHDYAQIGDVRLHYAKAGTGDELVLLLHGFPEFWYSWRHQLESLGSRYTVVAPDLRGYNLSGKPTRVEDYKVNRLVGDVVGLIKHFGRERAAVVGHDWGAIVAWEAALRHPEAVRKLVALQVPPPAAWRENLTLRQLLSSWYMLFFQLPLLPELALRYDDYALLKKTLTQTTGRRRNVFTPENIAEYKKSWREPLALESAVNYYRANALNLFALGQGVNASTNKVSVPTMFIYGERDFAVMRETARDVGRFVAAPYREERLANAGHWVQQEAAAEVNELLGDFLRN